MWAKVSANAISKYDRRCESGIHYYIIWYYVIQIRLYHIKLYDNTTLHVHANANVDANASANAISKYDRRWESGVHDYIILYHIISYRLDYIILRYRLELYMSIPMPRRWQCHCHCLYQSIIENGRMKCIISYYTRFRYKITFYMSMPMPRLCQCQCHCQCQCQCTIKAC